MSERTPDPASEARLHALQREARDRGVVQGSGGRPSGAPFPTATPDVGYYGLPLLKKPVWSWEAPVYLFVGGVVGAAAIIAALAGDRDRERAALRRDARWIAAAGGPISAALLTIELGRTDRFLNMLRVFKVRSPMSMGSWILTAFSTAAAAAAFAELMRGRTNGSLFVRTLDSTGGAVAAATGSLLATYTGVLIGSTAIPVWNAHARELPVLFGAAGLASGASLLELFGHRDSALNRLALAAAATETVIDARIEADDSPASLPLKRHPTSTMTRVGALLSGPIPIVLRLMARRTPPLRLIAALAAMGGSLVTRLAWIAAGRASAEDPVAPLELPDPKRLREARQFLRGPTEPEAGAIPGAVTGEPE